MSENRELRAKEVFLGAADLAAGEREAFLAEACAGDAALRARVEALLRADIPTPTGLEPFDAGSASEELVGRRVGRFQVRALLGRGGFGVVYRAEQVEPVRRDVALKVIRPGFGSAEIIGRFEAERQALALMDHPNVARIFDAGTLPDGRPYFAMELVEGEPITTYCGTRALAIEPRLQLFLGVCDAVRHAHAKGVIHRDLKPSNILVGGEPARPRVIDFGIAKALDGPLTGVTLATERGALIGTPEYMSPEQASLLPTAPDTRIDVYALGVVLYELLTGDLPFTRERFRRADLGEIQRIIREETPARPSLRASRPGPPGSAPGSTEARLLRGDLDWIVMRCLEKEAGRRYPTVDALAADVSRYLRREPVEAGPPGTWYRVGKFLRRHRGPAAAAAVFAVTLTAATTTSLLFAIRAERSRLEAEARANQLKIVTDFQASALSNLDPFVMGRDIRAAFFEDPSAVKPLLPTTGTASIAGSPSPAEPDFTGIAVQLIHNHVFSPSVRAVDNRFPDQPDVRARLLLTLGESMRSAGLLTQSEAPLQRAYRDRDAFFGPDHPLTLEAANSLALLLQQSGRLEEARGSYEDLLPRAARALGEDDNLTLRIFSNLGLVLSDLGLHDEAEPYHLEARARSARVNGADHPYTLAAMNNLGRLRLRQERFAEAGLTLTRTLEAKLRVLGADDPSTIRTMSHLSVAEEHLNQLDRAEAHGLRVVDSFRRTLGDEHPDTLTAKARLAELRLRQGRPEEAVALGREALEGRVRVLGPGHPETVQARAGFGGYLRHARHFDEAERHLRTACIQLGAAFGQTDRRTALCRSDLARLYRDTGRFSAASEQFAHALDACVATLGWCHHETRGLVSEIAAMHLERGWIPEAALMVARAADGMRESPDAPPECVEWLASLYDRLDEAAPGNGHAGRAAALRRPASP